MSAYQIIGVALIMFALGILVGHGVGYARAIDIARRRPSSPQYRRVGTPE